MAKIIDRAKIDLLNELVKTSFKMRYQNSILGILWVLIKPYATFLVMYFVWSKISSQSIENYPLYLLIGIVFYTYFNELAILGQMSLLERAHIILKVNFPRQIAIISALFSGVINLFINLIFIFIILVLQGKEINPMGILYVLFLTLIIFLFNLGLSFFTSILTVRFRDLKNIFELAFFLLFWATPIMYVVDNSLFDSFTAKIIRFNPIGIILNQVRAGFGIYGDINLPLMLAYFAVSVLIVILGWIYFNYKVKQIAEFF
ncbi:MAG: ABC transporter permease [Candidatus Dojkabacteria bacterium]